MSEDPKSFIQQHAPGKPVLAICPIQGMEDDYWDFYEEDASKGFYKFFSAVEIDPQDARKIPAYFKPVKDSGMDMVVYDTADLYILELLALLRDKGIRTGDVYSQWPNKTMINPYALEEAEDPKDFLKSRSQQVIWPSEYYAINLWKEGEDWKQGELCPAQINPKNELLQFDGMYGLNDELFDALGIVGREPTPAEENIFEREYGKYMGEVYASVKRGITSGTLNGIAGVRHWQIVYVPRDEGNQPNWNRMERVEPGRQYGPRLTPESDRSTWSQFRQEALRAARAILDGEDPKSVFKRMRTPEEIYRVKISSYTKKRNAKNRNRWIGLGSFDVNLETNTISNQRYSPNLARKPSAEDFEAIKASLKQWGDKMAGHYPISEKWPGTYHWQAELLGDLSRYRPVLVVEGPGWKIEGPLLIDSQWNTYTWRFHKLTPQQRQFMNRHGEMIAYAMNEGDVFKGEITEETEDNMDEQVGTWYVKGNPQRANQSLDVSADWSGEASPLP